MKIYEYLASVEKMVKDSFQNLKELKLYCEYCDKEATEVRRIKGRNLQLCEDHALECDEGTGIFEGEAEA